MYRSIAFYKMKSRAKKLYHELSPKYIRCYDNHGDTFDRYTVVFTKKRVGENQNRRGEFVYVGMSKRPYHPLGFYQHGFSDRTIDSISYSHLGKKIKFHELPDDCQKAIIEDYNDLWKISEKDYDGHVCHVLDEFVNHELIPNNPELRRFQRQFDNVLKVNH